MSEVLLTGEGGERVLHSTRCLCVVEETPKPLTMDTFAFLRCMKCSEMRKM